MMARLRPRLALCLLTLFQRRHKKLKESIQAPGTKGPGFVVHAAMTAPAGMRQQHSIRKLAPREGLTGAEV